jgi:dephospho-CoA kinase
VPEPSPSRCSSPRESSGATEAAGLAEAVFSAMPASTRVADRQAQPAPAGPAIRATGNPRAGGTATRGAAAATSPKRARGGKGAKAEPSPTVPLIGVTGAMGAGKSTALEAMRALGAVVLSTDAVVHELYRCERVIQALVEHWGEEVAPDGVADRQAIAERAFASDEERAWLERLLWPLVGERVAVWLALARTMQPPPRAAVVEMPLLFESGMDRACDATVALLAGSRVRAQRLSGRDQARLAERSARQLTEEEKAARATFVVRNDRGLDELRSELSAVLDKLSG